MVEENEERPKEPVWQSTRSEAWARGKDDKNPSDQDQYEPGVPERVRRSEQEMEPVRAQAGDTPEMIEKRKKMQRREPGQSLVAAEPSDGFSMDEVGQG